MIVRVVPPRIESGGLGDPKTRVRQPSDFENQVRQSRGPQKSIPVVSETSKIESGCFRDLENRVSCNMDLWFDGSRKGKQCLGKIASSLIGHLAFASRRRIAVLNNLSKSSIKKGRTVLNVRLADDECCLIMKSLVTCIYNMTVPGRASNVWGQRLP